MRLRHSIAIPRACGLALSLLLSASGAFGLPFTGSLSFSHYEFLTSAPLFEGPRGPISGAGVGVSTKMPNRVSGFQEVTGFTGSRDYFGGTIAPTTLFRFQIEGIRDANLGGTPLRGPLAVPGEFRVAYGIFRQELFAPLTVDGTRGLGLGGVIDLFPLPTLIDTALSFSEWTTGLARVVGFRPGSFNGGTAGTTTTISRSGFDARTASGRGSLQLVTPIRIVRGGEVGGAAFAVLDLVFVPEPASAILLGGALALLALARRRAG